MVRKLISVLLTAWILLMMPMAASAEEFDKDLVGSISVTLMDPDGKTPIAGAELSLYYVATVKHNSSNRLSYTFTGPFTNCGAALDDPALATKLDIFVNDHAVPTAKLVTDEDGNVTFTNLPLGLYFVKQTGAVAGYAPCTPFLVTVPNYDDEGYVYDVNASPKTDVAKLTDIIIQKIWNTDASVSTADSVTVQLLKDGAVVATAVLKAQNEWKTVYPNMPESDAYSILEVNIPEGFTATYSQRGYVFTVTNSPALIQTGQLVWPIPVLALAGLCLITIGAIVLRTPRKQHA